MAQGQGRTHNSRVARLSPRAEDDRLITYLNTEQRWGSLQADNYDDFLVDTIQQLADNPGVAPLVENLDNIRSRTARWKGARHGHRIFFRETDYGIYVLRILHSAMDWPEHIKIE